MNCVKFISRCGSQSCKQKRAISRNIIHFLKHQSYSTSISSKFENYIEEENFLKKILYNEVLKKHPPIVPEKNEPICLKYLMPENEQKEEIKNEDLETEKEGVNFPYGNENEKNEENVTEIFTESVKNFTPSDYENIEVPEWKTENYHVSSMHIEQPLRWALTDNKQNSSELEDVFKFGSYNPKAPISHIPCGGCGAFLHCNDPKLPGFIPAELFETKNRNELRGEKCQRCHFLKEFNVALGVNVSPSEYKNLISSIKDKKGLAIVMIDILDFPCSIFPGIFDLIGSTRPIVIVANKVDLLIQEGPEFKRNFKESLIWALRKQNIKIENIKHIELISAKTGYGIERLIDVLFSNWGNNGDIYLIGCTNVGKSSLFNALIQSDLCKIKAINLLQRATVSSWPGTTLNLLKFPIMKTYEWRLILRTNRLFTQRKEEKAFKQYQCLGQRVSLEQIPLKEYVGRTFLDKEDSNDIGLSDDSSSNEKRKGIDPHSQDFARGFWCYDTPGVVHHDQIVNFLTASELLLTVPKKMLLPRNFLLQPGSSLFIAGLARLDYVKGADLVWFTVYASMELPITVTKIEDAEDVYQKLLGTPYFRVPVNGKERLAKWPKLSSKKLEIIGKIPRYNLKPQKLAERKIPKEADADIVLSSAGWVSLNVPLSYRCLVEAWTPLGKGIYLRDPPLIKKGHEFRGPRISKTPAFKTIMKETDKYSLIEEPEF